MNGSLIREVSKWIALKFRLRNRNFPYPDSWCGKVFEESGSLKLLQFLTAMNHFPGYSFVTSETQFCKGRPPAPPSYPRLRPLFWQTVPQVPQDAWSCAIWCDGPTVVDVNWCEMKHPWTTEHKSNGLLSLIAPFCWEWKVAIWRLIGNT